MNTIFQIVIIGPNKCISMSVFLSDLLQSGVNLVYIRDLLGHSDISTTEIYARADEKMKRKALMEAYSSPASDELPTWKKDKDLLDWLKSL